jgi:hypothetical protein
MSMRNNFIKEALDRTCTDKIFYTKITGGFFDTLRILVLEAFLYKILPMGFFLQCMYFIQHCFICNPSDSTGLEDAVIESRTAATLALAVRQTFLQLR